MNEDVMDISIVETIRNEGMGLVEKANGLASIKTDAEFREACEFRKLVNGFAKDAILKCKPLRDATTKSWKEAIRFLDNALEPFEQVKTILDAPISQWNRDQERLRKLEEERRRAIAKKAQEDEQIAMALEAQSSGDTDRAEAILNQPLPPASVLVPKAAPVVGMSFTKYYGVDEVIDLRRLAQACINGDVSMAAIEPNMVFLRKIATDTKGTAKFPGVTFTVRDGVRS